MARLFAVTMCGAAWAIPLLLTSGALRQKFSTFGRRPSMLPGVARTRERGGGAGALTGGLGGRFGGALVRILEAAPSRQPPEAGTFTIAASRCFASGSTRHCPCHEAPRERTTDETYEGGK